MRASTFRRFVWLDSGWRCPYGDPEPSSRAQTRAGDVALMECAELWHTRKPAAGSSTSPLPTIVERRAG